MEIRELRIGNYILFGHDGAECTVFEIDKNGLTVKFHDKKQEEAWIEAREFEGIKLTEQWLTDFGAKEMERGRFRIDRFLICFNQRKNGETFHVIDIVFRGMIVSHAHEVHQLQNLYLCLCGKELTLNKNGE